MAEREKVIAALEWCIEKPCNPKCPYFTQEDKTQAYCLFKKIMPDALALLKEQEPRVMSFNELKFDTVYWIELKDVMPWPVAMARMRGNPEYLVFVDYHGDKWDVSKYRIKEGGWRCWTSRPSPEQMRNTPWKGEENHEK